jgi:hypothetical protein
MNFGSKNPLLAIAIEAQSYLRTPQPAPGVRGNRLQTRDKRCCLDNFSIEKLIAQPQHAETAHLVRVRKRPQFTVA